MQDNREKLQQNHNNHHLTKLVKGIFNENGLRGFYHGIRIDLIRVLPANAITFMVYEHVKKKLLIKPRKSS